MITTAVLGFVGHQLLTLFAFTAGVLLVCDAWFDVLTAKRGNFVVSILSAVLGELPVGSAPHRVVPLKLREFLRTLTCRS